MGELAAAVLILSELTKSFPDLLYSFLEGVNKFMKESWVEVRQFFAVREPVSLRQLPQYPRLLFCLFPELAIFLLFLLVQKLLSKVTDQLIELSSKPFEPLSG